MPKDSRAPELKAAMYPHNLYYLGQHFGLFPSREEAEERVTDYVESAEGYNRSDFTFKPALAFVI